MCGPAWLSAGRGRFFVWAALLSLAGPHRALNDVRVNGRQIRLTGQFDDKGVTGTAAVVGAVALVPLAGFFMTGTSARIPMGSPVKAFVDEDVVIASSTPTAPALVVPAAAPTPAGTSADATAPK